MTSFPKIALVTETWPPEINGVAMTLSRLVEGMRRRGYPLQVIRPKQSCDVGSNANNFLVPGAPIPGYNGLLFGLPVRGRLLTHWKTQRPQLVHVATEGPLGWAALSAAHELRIPVTSSFHTQFHQYCGHYGIGWLQRVIASYLKNFHNKTLFTLVPNESLRGLLETEGYRNVGVLGRGIDTVLFDPARRSDALRTLWQADDDTLVVLHVGRLAAEKNLKTVMAAFDALRAKHAKAKMVWVGAGPQLTKMKRKLPDHIFVGMKVGEELATHYASADIFLFASMTETFGNVTLEAMASGLAVVAYRYAAAQQFVTHGHNGLLADFGDLNTFKTLAASLGEDVELVKQMGKQARLDIQHVGWDHVLDQFSNTVDKAIRQENHQ